MWYIRNISWSLISSFEYSQLQFYESYVLRKEFIPNEYMKFWIDYEEMVAKKNYNLYKWQHMLLEKFNWYNIIGFIDFAWFWERVEVKTKSWWWSDTMVQKSRQFRIYNHYRWDNRLLLHQYNKIRKEVKIKDIWWIDDTFEYDLMEKIKEIEKFLSRYDFKFLCNIND